MKGYHIGYMNSEEGGSESLTQNVGGRSTGYFGTGCYFTLDSYNSSYKDRWAKGNANVYEIDLDRYNLIEGSLSLHKFLKTLNQYVRLYPKVHKDLDKWYDIAKLAMDITDSGLRGDETKGHPFETYAWNVDYIQKELKDSDNYDIYMDEENDNIARLTIKMEKFDKKYDTIWLSRIMSNLDREKAKELDKNFLFDLESVRDMRNLKIDIEIEAKSNGFSMEQVEKLSKEIYEELKSYYSNEGYLDTTKHHSELKSHISIPTMFLEKLGYDGVIPDNSTNNYTYGGVIFSNRLDKKDVKLIERVIDMKNRLFERIYEESNFIHFREFTTINLKDNILSIFKKYDVQETDEGMLSKIDKLCLANKNTKYTRLFGKIVPDARTNLQLDDGTFCTKEQFKQEFIKKYQKEIDKKNKSPSAASSTATTFMNRLLTAFLDNGFIDSVVENKDTINEVSKIKIMGK